MQSVYKQYTSCGRFFLEVHYSPPQGRANKLAVQYEMVILEDIYYTTNNTQIGQVLFRTLYVYTYTYIHVTTVYDKKFEREQRRVYWRASRKEREII